MATSEAKEIKKQETLVRFSIITYKTRLRVFVTDYVCQGKLGFKETIVSTYYFLSICFLVYYCERYFKKH